MKRIKTACLEQTIHFQLKEDFDHEMAVKMVQEEYAHYKKMLERKNTKYKIVEEIPQEDGSLMIRIKKQYLHHEIGDYFD